MPPIFRLPNELLTDIFGYVAIDESNSNSRDMAEVMKLRSVCRTFRDITYDMAFWYKERFDLVTLLPESKSKLVRVYNHIAQAERFQESATCLDAILADQNLLQVFARRSEWYFDNLVSFLCVQKLVPSFQQDTTAVEFRFENESWTDLSISDSSDRPSLQSIVHIQDNDTNGLHQSQSSLSPIQFAFVRLAHCRCLISLELQWELWWLDEFLFDLDLVVSTCPLLRILHMRNVWEYSGTLRDLSKLEDLHISGTSKSSLEIVLPRASGTSLTQLSLLDYYYDSNWPIDTFDVFSNITALRIAQIKVDFCGLVTRSNLRLVDLRIHFNYEPLDQVLEMLSAPCLRDLKILHLSFGDFDGFPPPNGMVLPFSRVLQNITTYLQSLEDLQLGMPLDLEWCALLRRLENIKTLMWFCPDNECRDGQSLLFVKEEGWTLAKPTHYERDMDIVERAFDRAFESAEEKPKIQFKIAPFWDSWNWIERE